MAIANSISPSPSQAVAAARAALTEALVLKVGQVLEALVVGKTPEGLTALKIGDQVVVAKLPQPNLLVGATLQLQVKVVGTSPQLQVMNALTSVSPSPLAGKAPAPVLVLPQVAVERITELDRTVSQPASGPEQTSLPATTKLESVQAVAGAISDIESRTVPPNASASVLAKVGEAAPIPQPNPPAAVGKTIEAPPSKTTEQSAPIMGQPRTTIVPAAQEPSVPRVGGPVPAAASVESARATMSIAAPTASATTAEAAAPPTASPQTARPVTVSAAPAPSALPQAVVETSELAAPNTLLLAQSVPRPAASAADLPRPTLVPQPTAAPQTHASQPPPPPATPQAALAQMLPEALSRQDSAGPLLMSLAAVVQKPGVLPEPVLRAALGVLAQRIIVSGGKVQVSQIEQAVARSGVTLEASLLKAEPQPRDAKAGLLALRETLGRWIGGTPAPVLSGREAAPPPIKGLPLRAVSVDAPPLPDAAKEVGRLLHGETDAAVSRLKLMQLASLPDSDPGKPGASTLRMELPFLIGHELVMAQIQVGRDSPRREADRRRGWMMRFALNFSQTGEVGAEVGVLGKAVNVSLWAAEPETAVAMNETLPELARSLEAAGLKPGTMRIRHGAPAQPSRPASGRLLDSVS